MYQILHTEPRDPLEVRADLPPAARDVFARLLAKSPDKRPAGRATSSSREIRRIADQLGEAELDARVLPRRPPFPDCRSATIDRRGVHDLRARRRRAGRRRSRAAPAPRRFLPPPRSTGAAAAPAAAAPGRERRPPMMLLFGLAAVLIAAAALPRRSGGARTRPQPARSPRRPRRRPRRRRASRLDGSDPPAAVPARRRPIPAALAPSAPTLGPLPTAGPRGAADAVVGAPRYGDGRRTRAPRPTPDATDRAPRRRRPPPPPPRSPAETRASRERAALADNVYRTRRYAKFGVSPDQARMYVDGRYVGIADDWDDRGGGRKFEFAREGTHRVRFELPGYRDLNVDILVTPAPATTPRTSATS